MAEIRLDLTDLSVKEISKIFSKEKKLIATCRLDKQPKDVCIERLSAAIKGNGPIKKSKFEKYIDIEYDAPEEYRNAMVTLARENDFKIIHSYHNFSNTDPFERLLEITGRCFEYGADIAKIATTAIITEEGVRTLRLYRHFEKERLLAFSMGESGKFTRFLSLNLGAPFTFAAPKEELATAPGQPVAEEAKAAVNPKSYPNKIRYKSLQTIIKAPSSKSHAQRAIIAASLTKGVSNIYGYTPCNDTDAALEMAKKFGVQVKYKSKRG
ncbi:MAG: type I 3-dehydroquinate dehydratase, partial [Bacteroidales bacterium]|nr:type I 3-dehydroquinate dehydratase [Bacteroidales bacterium]